MFNAAPSRLPAADPSPSESPIDVLDPEEAVDFLQDLADPNWWMDLLTGPILRSAVVVILALVARFILVKFVNGLVKGLSKAADSGLAGTGLSAEARAVGGEDYLQAERRRNRANTLGQMMKNVGSVVIIVIALLMILAEWGFNLAPLVAGAGIAGVALGFGAQTLVADFLSGVFMLLEDQYGVGDIIDLDGTSGTVEDVQLRVTRLRSVDGVVWWVRNGEVKRVGNMSQNWSRTVLDVGVAYESDVSEVRRVMSEEAHQLYNEPDWNAVLLEEPEVWGVESLGNDAVVIRLVLKTHPGEQWRVARELRERIKARFDAEGIEIPFPQRTVWVRHADSPRVIPPEPASSGS